MPIPFYSIGLISVFVSTRDQRIGDLVAGTVVVRERETEAPTFSQVFNAPVSDTALRRSFKPVDFTAEINFVTEGEIEVVEAYSTTPLGFARPHAACGWPGAWRCRFFTNSAPAMISVTFTYEGFLEELLHRYRDQNRFKK